MVKKIRLLALGLVLALVSSSAALAVPVSGISTTEYNEGADKAASFYNPMVVNNISLTLPQASVDALNGNPYSSAYQTASVTITTADGVATTLNNIGVRIKGQATRTNLYGKAPLKLKFDAFVSGQKFLGLTRMTLNSMVQDPSFVHEATAYRMYRAMGVIAPRTTYTWLTLNGADFGLYMNVESVDSQMLKRWLNPKHLYSSNCYGADLTYYQSGCYDTNFGDDDRSDLNAAIAVSLLDGQDWWDAVNKVADMNAVITLMATDIYTSNWDGYTDVVQNNYYIVFDDKGKLRIIPWGQDGAFPNDMSAQLDWLGQGPAFRNWGNGQRSVMLRKCVAYEPCQKLLVKTEALAKTKAEQLDLVGFKNKLAAVLNTAYISHETRANPDVNSAKGWQNWLDQFFPMRTQALTNFLLNRAPETPELSLNGSATVGSTLTAAASTWDFTAQLSYKWLRDGVVIPGQESATYTLLPQDNAHLISVSVKASKGYLTPASTTSQAVLITGYIPPVAALTGDSIVGGTLTATPANDANLAVTYKWYRSGKPINGVTGNTYTATTLDYLKNISVVATITQVGFPKVVSTSNERTITAGNLPNATMQITGTPVVGNSLVVSATTIPGARLSIQWLRDSVPIKGATRGTYLLTAADAKHSVTAQLTFTKTAYTAKTITGTAQYVSEGTFTKAPTPTISGTAKVGKTISVATGLWDSGVLLKYQWYRNGSTISNATSKTFKLTSLDLGAEISVVVTGSKLGYLTTPRSSQSITVN